MFLKLRKIPSSYSLDSYILHDSQLEESKTASKNKFFEKKNCKMAFLFCK